MAAKRPLDNCQTPPSKMLKMSNSPSQSSRTFKEAWKSGHSWLKYDSKTKSMFCDVCQQSQNINTFTSGCKVMKKESVTKHAATKDHCLAFTAAKQRTDMSAARQAALSKSEDAVTAAMTNVYFAAKHNLANSLVPELNDIMILQGISKLADLKVDGHTTYSHNNSLADFQMAISDVLEDELKEKVSKSGKFSLMLDESTDCSIHQNMIVYIRILEAEANGCLNPHTYFLGISELEKACAESIFSKVNLLLEEKGIDISKLCGVSTDGAAVMLGNRTGVVKKLKDQSPGVLSTHCIAHRLALSCCTGADSIPYLVKFQEILNSIYKYFHYSPKNMARLEKVQSLTPGQSSRFKQVFHTRWLSFEGSVEALVTNYSNLLSVFLEEKSGKSLSLYKPISCFKFLYVAHFLCDVLKPLVTLSKMFQKSDLDFSQVTPLLSSTISRLEILRDKKNGQNMSVFLDSVPSEPRLDSDGLCTFEFNGHTIRDSEKQRIDSISVCNQFVTGMVKSLNDRFADNHDSGILTGLSNVFNPDITQSSKESDVELVSDYLGSVGFAGYRDELNRFLDFAHSSQLSGKSLVNSSGMVNFAFKYRDIYPASSEAAERLLVAPVSTADCERGFSRQNLVKTSLRNSLSIRSLDNLLRIAINGQPIGKFDFKAAFSKWASQKSRRILK